MWVKCPKCGDMQEIEDKKENWVSPSNTVGLCIIALTAGLLLGWAIGLYAFA